MTGSFEATDLPEAIRENRTRLETGRAPAADDVFGAWEDDPDGIWPQLRDQIADAFPGIDPAGLDATEGRPSEVLDLIGQHTGLDRGRATAALEDVLASREGRRRRGRS